MSPATRRRARSLLTVTGLLVLGVLLTPIPGAAGAPAPTPALRTLTIRTVPPIAGVQVQLDGRTLVTGADGTVQTTITKEQRDAIKTDRDAHLIMTSTQVTLPDQSRGDFHGWYDGGYRYTASDRSGQVEIAAFDVSYLTRFSFVDTHGKQIPPARVGRIELRDQRGATAVTHHARPLWLVGRAVVANAGRVSLRDVQYRFTEVVVDGVNVVRRGQVRFWPRTTQSVTVPVIVFPVTFESHDALFGLARGSQIEIQLENGTVRTYPLKNGSVTVPGLTPGKYVVTVDTMGMGKETTFQFSKATTADIKIIDPLDLGVVGVIGLMIFGGLLLIGLRMRRRRVAREERATAAAHPDTEAGTPAPELSATGPR